MSCHRRHANWVQSHAYARPTGSVQREREEGGNRPNEKSLKEPRGLSDL